MPGISVSRIPIGFNKGSGGGGLSPSVLAKALYYGRIADISGGHMPNLVSGATDYITVGGSVGSYTFQVPQTQAYIDADTEFVWVKNDGITWKDVTELELVSIDYQRTIVKYNSESPYAIEEIIILKVGEVLTEEEDIELREMMLVSPWWDNTLSIYGEAKGNRGQGRALPLDSDAVALFDRMLAESEDPAFGRKLVYDAAFKLGKSKAFWTKLDAAWLIAAHGNKSAKYNILDNSHNITLISTPAFDTDRGYTTDGIGKVLNLNFTPSSEGESFLQNSAAMGFYCRDFNNATTWMMGAGTSPDKYCALSNNKSGKVDSYFNGISQNAHPDSTTAGLVIVTRSNSTQSTNYKDLVGYTSNSNSVGLPDVSFYLGALNLLNAIDQPKVGQFAFAFVSGGLSATDVADIYEVFVDGYLNSIGAKI